MVLQDFINKGITIVNSMGEKRITSKNSIVFPNGWVASIVKPTSRKAKYSVAVCDYDGYFNWDVLKPFGEDDGVILCNSEEEVCKALTVIELLKSII